MNYMVKVISTGLVAVGLFGCSQEDSEKVSKKSVPVSGVAVSVEQYGDKWPFSVESGVVDCVKGVAAVFKTQGQTYQLNGTASTMGYKPIDSIWRDNPAIPTTKINIGPMIQLALKQC